MNQKLRKTCFLGSILLFLLLAFLVALKLTTHVDEAVSKLFIELRNPGLTMFFKQITDFGYVQVLVILIAVILIVFHKYRFAYILPIHVGICVIFNLLLKNLFLRPRPTFPHLVEETGFSFPSGHAMVTMTAYGYLIYVVYHYIKIPWLKYLLITVLSCLIILVGISRIFLGVHYLTDVLAGFSISIFYLMVFTKLKIFSLESKK